ncbi:alpha/beta hydrolase, partial [Priestia megaterium]
IGAGTNDPICPASETEELSALLEKAGADVQVHWESFGHQLTRTEIEAAEKWYRAKF